MLRCTGAGVATSAACGSTTCTGTCRTTGAVRSVVTMKVTGPLEASFAAVIV